MKSVVASMAIAFFCVTSVQAESTAPALMQVAIKKGCPNRLAAKCPPGKHRVCSQTNSKGCCTRSSCEAN
jgi:hypothetical protein